jgi:hypothetical protein
MRARQNTVLAALQRAQRFLAEYATQLLSAVDLTGARKRLDDIVASFAANAFDQSANDRGAKGETLKQQQLRDRLCIEQMRPIAEIARRNLRTVPEFKALQMPRQTTMGPAFIASAKGMGDAAAIHKDTLIERGLPADFLDQFQTALAKLEVSVSDREKSRTRRMGATKALAFEEQEGRSVLKVLDALVRRALRGNEALLGTWEGARAIHRLPSGSATAAPTSVVTASGTPASSAASGASPDAIGA